MPISKARLRSELDALLRRADIDAQTVTLVFARDLDHEHARNRRRYASVWPEAGRIEAAHAILDLERQHRCGVLAHEIGHLLAAESIGADHSEREADLMVWEILGLRIEYDRTWPGKGLQVVRNTRPQRT